MMKINTIYPAFMGEVNCYGIGVPCTFVRLAGCNLRCYSRTKGITCDTPEALEITCGTDMSVSEILKRVRILGNKIICVTGGEPLVQACAELFITLTNAGFQVVVETNGSQSIRPYRHIRNVSFIVDYKSTASGETSNMLKENWSIMEHNDFLKFVVDTIVDYEDFKFWIHEHPYFKGRIAVGTFWGSEMPYAEIMHRLHTDLLDNKGVYLNIQAHKMTCLYDEMRDKEAFSKVFIPKNL